MKSLGRRILSIASNRSTCTTPFTSRYLLIYNSHRQFCTSKMPITVELEKGPESPSANNNPSNNIATLRYEPGSDKLTFTFTLPPSGPGRNPKDFNFNRPLSEPLSSFAERIKGNILKKRKKFEGDVKLILNSPESQPEEDVKLSEILEKCMDLNSKTSLKLKIEDSFWEIDYNPPEIYQIKFGKNVIIGFPTFPFKMETSSNFDLTTSKFKWEFLNLGKLFETEDSVTTYEKRDPNRFNKVKKILGKTKVDDCWEECSTNLVYLPDKSLEGSSLRFTLWPSDGKRLGASMMGVLSGIISFPTVSSFIYEERLERMGPKKYDLSGLRAVSYNVLADSLATTQWFSQSPPESLEVDYRLPLLIKEITSYECDLLCMQEVDDKLFKNNFEPLLGMTANLKGIFNCKDGAMREGLATFYNSEKLTLIKSEVVTIRERMEKMDFWSRISEIPLVKERLDDRNTLLQFSLFQSTQFPNKFVYVANTHLYFHPNADHIRLLQTMACTDYIQKQIESFKEENPGKTISFLFFGDFNCTPPYSSVRLLTSGKINSNDDDWTCHEPEKLEPGFNFEHNLSLATSHPNEELSHFVHNFEGCIDYIFYQPETMDLVKAYPPPSKDKLASIMGCDQSKVVLPNFYAPSDHLPLIVDFSFKSE